MVNQYPDHIIKVGTADKATLALIKVRLNEILHLTSPLDITNPNFGEATEAAVKQFQKQNQLIQDGEVGELTWERLFKISVPIKPTSASLSLRAVQIGDTQLFVRELTNHNDGKEVEQYLKAVGLDKGFAWCMAFVYWCFLRAANELGLITPVPKTAGVLDCLAKAKQRGITIITDYTQVQPGDQGILDFGGGKGHTFLVNELRGLKVFTVEGNTSADPTYVGEDREGNGVFERLRVTSSAKAYIRYK